MANLRISQLPSIGNTGYTTTDILPIVNYTVLSGTTSQTTITDLKTYINSGNTVSISGGTGIQTGGTYPNFTITNSSPDQIVSISGGTGIQTGGTYPNFTITNSSPDQIVSISGGTNLSITGTYPNFGVNFTGSTGTSFTGGTVSGATNFTSGLTANTLNVNGNLTVTGNTSLQGLTATTISATTYQNLPVSGLTPGSGIGINNSNGNFTISFTGSTGTPISSYNNIGSTGTSFNWDVSGVSTNYQVTLTANTTLTLTGVRNGEYGTIIVTQDAVGGRTLTLGSVNGAGTTHRVANGGGGSVVLSSNPSITDILTFTYNGSTMYWTVGNDYS